MKPIIFSTPMVQAILEGRKTMTRRIMNPQPWVSHMEDNGPKDPAHDEWEWTIPKSKTKFPGEAIGLSSDNSIWDKYCPYGGAGDILWVRESFKNIAPLKNVPEINEKMFVYKADDNDQYPVEKWKPSIHMPKDACRIFLKIKSIKVERVQDISEADAFGEGVQFNDDESHIRMLKDYEADASGYGHPDHDFPTVSTARDSFFTLWKKINGVESWDDNPWVWVIEFERCENPAEL